MCKSRFTDEQVVTILLDATIVAAPKQRNTEAEKQAIKDGRIPEDWEEQAGEAPPEGSRCALDSQIHQGQADTRMARAARRSGDPGLRLQEPHRASIAVTA